MRIVFFGDSICVGQGVSIHKGWVPRISARLEELSAEIGEDLVIVNASVNGSTTRQALERMPYEVQAHGVDVLLVQFGMNDCNYWETDKGVPRVSPEGFAANLKEILMRGRVFGARRIILNTNHPTTRTKTPLSGGISYEDSNRRYNEIVRAVASNGGAEVCLNDIEQAFLDHVDRRSITLSELLLPDALHLSPKGHDIYFDLTSPLVESIVRDCIRQKS